MKHDPLQFASLDQSSKEWLLSKVGRLTASKASVLMTKPRSKADKEAGKLSEKASSYMMEIASEIALGKPAEIFGKPLEWGHTYEPIAREHFESVEFCEVIETGLILDKENSRLGASLDGYYKSADGKESNLEIKCPYNNVNHLKYFLGAEIPKDYFLQMQWQMMISGRDNCTFVSYRPDVDEHLKMYRREVPRDEEVIAELRESAGNFLKKLDEVLSVLNLPPVLIDVKSI